ncbi:MAG TPA: hypothetical protein VGF94_22390 [Kofleriaceae bacterium]|jgi:hypothetical protein
MDKLIEQAWWVRGLTACRGVAVVRPSYIAFVPCQRPKHLVAEVAWAAGGFVTVGAREIPVATIVQALQSAPLLDMRARELAAQLAGLWWTPQTARWREKRFPLRRSRRGVWFEAADASIRLARTLPLPELAQATTLLATWPRAA